MIDLTPLALAFGSALVLAVALTPLARRAALALGAVDAPGHRKIHTTPIPRLGGAAVVAAILGATAVVAFIPHPRAPFGGEGFQSWSLVSLGALGVFLLGCVDDVRALPARFKFVVELLAALAVVTVAELPTAVDLSPFGPVVELGPVMSVAAAIWIVAVTNAFNMIDGMDGLAAGVGAIAAAALASASALLGAFSWSVVLVATAGAFAGFLPYNARPARIFLGDAGSLAVGFLLGTASLLALQRHGAWLAFPAGLALGLPLADCCFAVVRRAWQSVDVVRVNGNREHYEFGRHEGIGLFTPDQRHLHHRLLDLRFTTGSSLLVLYGVSVALGVVAIATVQVPWIGPVAGFLGLAACVYFAPRWLYQELRLVDRGAWLPLLEFGVLKRRYVHVLYDALMAAGSYVGARLLVGGLRTTGGLSLLLEAGLVAASIVLGLWVTGAYRGAYRHAGLTDVLRVVRGVVLGTVLACAARYFLIRPGPSLAVWALCFYLMASLLVGARISFRVLDHLYQRARSTGKRTLIYGAGRAGELALREMLSNPELGLQPVGFADDEPGLWGRSYYGYAVHPGGAYLAGILSGERIERVVLATRKIAPEMERLISDLCTVSGVPVMHFELIWPSNGKPAEADLSLSASRRILKSRRADDHVSGSRFRSSADA